MEFMCLTSNTLRLDCMLIINKLRAMNMVITNFTKHLKNMQTDINQSLTIAVDPFRRTHQQNMQPEFFNFYEPCRIIINSNSDYPADELNKFLTFVWNSNSGTIRCKLVSTYVYVELSEEQNRFQLERIR